MNGISLLTKTRGTLARLTLLSLLNGLLVVPLAAYAHPDFRVMNDVVAVGPGAFVEFPLSVHFHRVVGSFEVLSPRDGRVTVLVMNDPAFTSYAKGHPTSVLHSLRKASQGSLNFLVACCIIPGFDDWTRYHLVIENKDSFSAATVRMRLDLIHDGGAVLVYNAEEFAPIFSGGFFGVVAMVAGLYLRHMVARGRAPIMEHQPGRKMGLVAVASVAVFATVSGVGLGLAMLGARSYGGSLIDGLVAIQADWSLPPGLFGSSESILAAALLVPWLFALLLWIMAFRMAVRAGSRVVGGIGVLQGAAPLVVGSWAAVNYGFPSLPTLVGGITTIVSAGISGLPQVMGGLYLIRRSHRKA